MTSINVSEEQHDSVYGSSFALYDQQALLEFLEPFKVRFRVNGLVPKDLFEGRRCLDAGCGNGRGSLFMLESGAAHVTAVDISEQNVETTRKNLTAFGFSNFVCQRTSLETLPFDEKSFDFVWCNGVVMHTANPDACITELTRVLKPAGHMWLYVYGAGGIYWYFVRQFRALLAHISVDQLIASLKLLNYPVRFIAEYIDDWKTPFLRAYREKTVRKKLEELGFVDIHRANKGMPYDTCARILDYPEERLFLGEGDLRYLAMRGSKINEGHETLNADDIDNPAEPDTTAVNLFGTDLEEVTKLILHHDVAAIAACARVQRYLRKDVLSSSARIDVAAMSNYLKETRELLRTIPQ